MKYFFRVLLVLVLAVAVVFGVYYRTNGNPFDKTNTLQLTTVSQQPATEKNSNRVLIASLPDDDFYLYKGSRGVVLTHGKKEYEFTNWSKMIDAQPPEMYLTNFDKDDDKELIIKAVSSQNESSGEYVYEVYLLDPKTDKKKNVNYTVYCASQTTWTDILDKQIREEIGQLKNCKKFLQVSMNSKSKTINYDADTGLALDGFNGYARAMQNGGKYLTFEGWSKGKGTYSINKKKEICISVEVNARYKGTDVVQTAGYINFKLDIKKGEFIVKNKTMNFKAAAEYKVSDPHTASDVKWSYTELNSDKSTDSADKIIDWVTYTTGYNADTTTQTLDLSSQATDIKNVSKIKITNSYAELTAKKGFSFAAEAKTNGEFSVIINSGEKDAYDIAYTAEIREVKGAEVLKITFDKSYPQSEIKTVAINYGTK
ncbi:MAG: hypothetical protein E7571_00030 [Ruminococcaceae bacterium]|nr:hypothetical protein [Oscillospiraceae bacterium]